METSIITEGLKDDIIKELKEMGACTLCILRYLGVKEPYIYRSDEAANKMVGLSSESNGAHNANNGADCDVVRSGSDDEPKSKLLKKTPCVACLGLLQECVEEASIDQLVAEINKAEIESYSYAAMLTLPIAVQIRAYSIWFHLVDKFPQVYLSMGYLKPEGVGMKNVWKWLVTGALKQRINPNSDWSSNGSLVINMFLKYQDEDTECEPLFRMLRKGNKRAELTRGAAESKFSTINPDTFRSGFGSPPPIPKSGLTFDRIACSHMAMFVAGRYCKYSRDVSQSPWLDDEGKRVRGLGSVQEFLSDQILPMFKSEQIKFSASGREDSDVRMLGKGRPFVVEIVNPRKTIFTRERLKQLETKINSSTSLISVRDLQIVEKRDLAQLKDGEETKSKVYCALCRTPGQKVTSDVLEKLNNIPMPLVLQQKTPIRVLHRRSLATRSRSILSISTELANKCEEMFILRVKTEAGTYVKEFVHGDFGRTVPSISSILGYPAEILALDVEAVELDWPREILD